MDGEKAQTTLGPSATIGDRQQQEEELEASVQPGSRAAVRAARGTQPARSLGSGGGREQGQTKLGPCVPTAGGAAAPREGQRVT